jgi:ATP-binding cassette, subfamily C, bacterial
MRYHPKPKRYQVMKRPQTFSSFVRYVFSEYPRGISILVTMLFFEGLFNGLSLTLIVPFIEVFLGRNTEVEGGGFSKIIVECFSFLGLDISLHSILLLFLILLLGQISIAQLTQVYTARIHVDFSKRLFRDLSNAYLKAGLLFFYDTKVGKLVNNITLECQTASNTLTLFSYFLRELTIAVIFLTIPLSISWKLSVCAIAIGIALTLTMRKLHLRAERYGQSLAESNIEVQSEVNEKLSAIKEIKSGVSEPRVLQVFEDAVSKKFFYRFKSMVNLALVTNLQTFFGGIILVFILFFSISILKIDFVYLTLFLFSFQRLTPRLTSIQRWYNEIQVTLPSLWLIFSTLEEAQAAEEFEGPEQIEIGAITDDIVFDNVSFSYKSDNREFQLKNINLKIEKNKITSIIGKSGAGKSTIVDMLLGFNRPEEGKIYLDDKPLEYYTIKSIRKRMGYVSQSPVLFNDSIWNNLCWYHPEASLKEVEEAVRIANIEDFILSLPDGYQTEVGERGVKLSGGQKQRIILARNILKPPDLLILDEATSNLDAESENLILRSIKTLSKRMTIVLITHRISTTRISDCIYLLENGEVVDSGTWDSFEFSGKVMSDCP